MRRSRRGFVAGAHSPAGTHQPVATAPQDHHRARERAGWLSCRARVVVRHELVGGLAGGLAGGTAAAPTLDVRALLSPRMAGLPRWHTLVGLCDHLVWLPQAGWQPSEGRTEAPVLFLGRAGQEVKAAAADSAGGAANSVPFRTGSLVPRVSRTCVAGAEPAPGVRSQQERQCRS